MIPSAKKLLIAEGPLDIDRVFRTDTFIIDALPKRVTNGLNYKRLGGMSWFKCASDPGSHSLFDTVRGDGKGLITPSSNPETSNPNQAFHSDGVTSPTTGVGNQRYALWSFLRARRFFDIVRYTGNDQVGRAIPHRLAVTPGLIIVKSLDRSNAGWPVRHRSFNQPQTVFLNGSLEALVTPAFWSETPPDASNFYVGNHQDLNGGGNQYVAYVFAHDPSPQGVIQCGLYMGNGSANGPIINLGWQPQFLLLKALGQREVSGNWRILDDKRGQAASITKRPLFPNTIGEEGGGATVAFLPTGFQPYGNDDCNRNPGTNPGGYIYMAIRKGKA